MGFCCIFDFTDLKWKYKCNTNKICEIKYHFTYVKCIYKPKPEMCKSVFTREKTDNTYLHKIISAM